MMNNSKYRVSDKEINDAIVLLDDCIKQKCLGQGDAEAVLTLIKRVAFSDSELRLTMKQCPAISKAIEEGYEDA